MSSHREAPEISKDPVADNADVYAFVSPDKPGTVTIISNFVPLQGPAGGPNFYEFGDDVLYSIYIDNDGDAQPDIEYQFQFKSTLQNPNTFLYNTGPVTSLTSPTWNARQFYSVTRIDSGKNPVKKGNPPGHDADPGPAWAKGKQYSTVLGTDLPCPPCNVGVRSMPDYTDLAASAIRMLPTGETVFCGQRNDPFYVDLGSIFDLGALRPFNMAHLLPLPTAAGVDGTKQLNIHSIAIQVPFSMLTKDGSTPGPGDLLSPKSVLGIWSAASRRKARVFDDGGSSAASGPWVQVSRLGNPLFNEVIVPLGKKDEWNGDNPAGDEEYLPNVQHPELGGLLNVLYPNVFTNLAALSASPATRDDLVAILLTGIPDGVLPLPAGVHFSNYTGPTHADMLRLNIAVPASASPSPLGILGGDLAGFPNGRRVADDIVAIELRAIAGATYPLVNHAYTPDGAAAQLTQGITPAANRYLSAFPYVGTPYDGYDTPSM
jgi:hypothetical protein